MAEKAPPLAAHSVYEAELFLLARACPHCGRGPSECLEQLSADAPRSKQQLAGLRWGWRVRCLACGQEQVLHFERTSPNLPDLSSRGARIVNHLREPSRLVDLNGWLGLFQRFEHSAEDHADARQARPDQYRALLCLEEALKFYAEDPAEMLPSEQAFFSPLSRRRFREHPETYSRDRWEDRRRRLPAPATLERAAARTENPTPNAEGGEKPRMDTNGHESSGKPGLTDQRTNGPTD